MAREGNGGAVTGLLSCSPGSYRVSLPQAQGLKGPRYSGLGQGYAHVWKNLTSCAEGWLRNGDAGSLTSSNERATAGGESLTSPWRTEEGQAQRGTSAKQNWNTAQEIEADTQMG